MAVQAEASTIPVRSGAPKMSRGISFAGHALAEDDKGAHSVAHSSNRRMSHTGSIQVRMPVQPMEQRKKHERGRSSRVDAPSALWTTINPQYTIEKARELYGGAPRPLTARHAFIQQAFLSDTEDWRSNAHIGTSKSHVANMNIVDPSKSEYLKETSKRKMSYYREQSLKRVISYRAVLLTTKGKLAESQYHDQYLDKEVVMETLKEQQKEQKERMVSVVEREKDAQTITLLSEQLTKSLSTAPKAALVATLSSRVREVKSTTSGEAAPRRSSLKVVKVEDLGMSRAISRIMTRSRAQTVNAFTKPAEVREESELEIPRMDEI